MPPMNTFLVTEFCIAQLEPWGAGGDDNCLKSVIILCTVEVAA